MKKSASSRTIAQVITHLTRYFIVSVISVVCVLAVVSQYNIIKKFIRNSLLGQVNASAARIKWVVQSYKNIAEGLGSIPDLSDPDASADSRRIYLENRCHEYGLIDAGQIRLDGYSDLDDKFRGDRKYFLSALKGEVVISDPIADGRTRGERAIVVASPVWRNGIYGSSVDSVLFCSIYPETFNDILQELDITVHSDAYIISEDGMMVASKKRNKDSGDGLLGGDWNISRIERQIAGGNDGIFRVRKGFFLHYLVSSAIDGTPGWHIVIDCPVSDFMTAFYLFLLGMVGVFALSYYMSTKQLFYIAERIARPVRKMADRLKRASAGDFFSDVDVSSDITEVKVIAEATQSLISRMDIVINGDRTDTSNRKIKDYFDYLVFSDCISPFCSAVGLRVCILDSSMNPVAGERCTDGRNVAKSNILISDRFRGVVEVYAEDGCKLSEDVRKSFARTVAVTIARFAESKIQQNSAFESWKQNENYNLKVLVSDTSLLTKAVDNLLDEIGGDRHSKANIEQDESIRGLEVESRRLIMKIDETTSLAADYFEKQPMGEDDYDFDALVGDIDKKCRRMSGGFSKIYINCEDGIPKRLFGDMDKIARMVSKCCVYMENHSSDKAVSLGISSDVAGYSQNLVFRVESNDDSLTEDIVGRLGILSSDFDCLQERLDGFEQNMTSVFRIGNELNAEISVCKDGSRFTVVFVVPQLEAV